MSALSPKGHSLVRMWTPLLAVLPLIAAMRVDPERILARLRIEAEIANDHDGTRTGRGRRQLQPKEISIQVTAPLFSSRLFEFGKDAEDNEVPQALDVGKKVQLTNPLNFYGEDYNTLYVLSNGAIGFEANARAYKAGLFPSGARMIAPFWNRNDLRKGGHVYYREITKGRVLERGQSEIRYQYDRSVIVKSAVVVTWEKMQPLEGTAALPDENTNTFQAALFITDNGTYANFIYSNIGWTQGAEAGFNRGDNSEHYALPTSGTGNIMYLEEYGNTGIPGEWMFELGEKRSARRASGELIVHRVVIVEKELAIHSLENVPKDVLNAGWEATVRQRKKIVMLDHRLSVLQTRFHSLTTIGAESLCNGANVSLGSKAMGTKHVMMLMSVESKSVIRMPCVQTHLDATSANVKKASQVLWQLKAPMKLFGKTYDKITVTTSGLLSITDVPKTFGDNLEQMHLTGVAPFFAPIDTSRGGHVTVAEVTDSDTLTRVTRSIQENYEEPTFQARSVLIVTYMNVTDGRAQRGNTFQTLLINGMNSKQEKMTFAQMLYKDMQWGDGAEAAIMTNDISSSVSLPGSGTQGIEQLTQLSNVGQPGIWLFRIESRPSPIPSTRFDTSSSAIAIPVDAPRIIQPQLVTPHSGKHNIHVNAQPEAPSAPSFAPVSSTPSTKTTRPRPRYESTPHRPIVSLGEHDFEELDQDVFEITFPPFVTVVPEMFTPKEKSKQLPDFTVQEVSTTTSAFQISTTEPTFPTFKLADSEDTLVTVSLEKSQPESTIKTVASTPPSTSAPSEEEAEVETKEETRIPVDVSGEPLQETTELRPITAKATEPPATTKATTERPTTSQSTTAAHIFVFTTTRAADRVQNIYRAFCTEVLDVPEKSLSELPFECQFTPDMIDMHQKSEPLLLLFTTIIQRVLKIQTVSSRMRIPTPVGKARYFD
ncbi:Nidogen-like protein [Teladorsagia circumcincta]|uniref:Nidogen-like protein n=1 Tax=Teladorsagia circumcincta TaxID=45464 RepID=A0A2G9UQI2_TELCI|nr:Nidogen-like protein [Teladorsagia circumcincta]